MNFRLQQPLMMAAKIEEEPVSFEGLNDELQTIFSEMSKSRSDLSACIDELQNSVSEMLDLTANAQQWEKDMKDLEDSEKKLIEEFNKVMSNLYLLPAYVLAASSGVSGLLSGHPRVCWLLGTITVVIIVLLAAMGLAISFVHRQLTDFKAKRKELVDERVKLHQRFLQRHVSSFSFVLQNSNPTLTKVENYEPKNPELDFLVQHYGKFLLLIITDTSTRACTRPCAIFCMCSLSSSLSGYVSYVSWLQSNQRGHLLFCFGVVIW